MVLFRRFGIGTETETGKSICVFEWNVLGKHNNIIKKTKQYNPFIFCIVLFSATTIYVVFITRSYI